MAPTTSTWRASLTLRGTSSCFCFRLYHFRLLTTYQGIRHRMGLRPRLAVDPTLRNYSRRYHDPVLGERQRHRHRRLDRRLHGRSHRRPVLRRPRLR